MKRAQSMGAIPDAITVAAQPVQLGWAQTENVAKLSTSAGAPAMGRYSRSDCVGLGSEWMRVVGTVWKFNWSI